MSLWTTRGRLSPLDHGRSGRHLHQVLAALFAARGRSSLAFCWSHVRRRFYERFVADASPIAAEALQRIALIYAVEKDIRGRSPDQRRAARQERSRPVVAELEPWLRAELPLLSQKSKLPEAIRYALSRWEGLSRFLGDGRIEINSNTVERSIRPIALNRKNALFAGSDEGASYCSSRHPFISQRGFSGRSSDGGRLSRRALASRRTVSLPNSGGGLSRARPCTAARRECPLCDQAAHS